MNVGVHPRIEARRREVREHGAHRRLRVVLALMLLVGLGGLGFWLLHSPLLAVDRIVVDGDVDEAVVLARAAEAGLEAGEPIAFVRRGAVAAAVTADPRVAEVRVDVHYPDEVAILVAAHRPLAWVDTGQGWLSVTAGGHVVATAPEAGAGPVVAAAVDGAAAGDRLTDRELLGGLEFVAGLPEHVAAATRVDAGDGGLVAEVAGHQVALGAPVRMADKAAAVAALVATLDAPGAIDVSTPDRPAVAPLTAQAEASLEAEG